MNYSDRVRSVRAAITTVEARKERQGAVCLILHGPSGSWTVNDGWKGGDGVSYPQWFGQGVRWYKDEPADILRNDLNTLQLTLLDLVGGNISIGFDNADDVDDTWGFEFSLTAITDGGDVSLVDPLGQPTVLAPPRRVGNVSSKSFYFKIPPPPPPSPPDTWQLVQSLIQQGKCDQAEGVANKPFQLAEVAFCFATHDEHLNAARVAGIAEQQLGTQSALSAGYKLMMRDLRTEQIAIDKVKQRQWQTARFVVDHPAPFRTALELIVDELYATWEKAIATFKDKDPFGPFKLVRREPSIEYTYTPFTIGTVTLIKNQTVVSIKLNWQIYDFVKRALRENEYSDGQITVDVDLVLATDDTDVLIDISAPNVGSIHMTADSPNPAFGLVNFCVGLLAIATLSTLAPNIHVATVSLKEAISTALPWLPAQLNWTLLSLEVRKDDIIVGAGFGP